MFAILPKHCVINTLEMFTKRWFGPDCDSLPLTEEKKIAVAAQFKAQGYRSFENYIDTLSDLHRGSFEWHEGLDRARKRSVASVTRGIGPPKQCCEVPIGYIASLPIGTDPLTPGGPICAKDWAIISAFHLTRGAESACALASSVNLHAER